MTRLQTKFWIKRKGSEEYYPVDSEGSLIVGAAVCGKEPEGIIAGEFYFQDGKAIMEAKKEE